MWIIRYCGNEDSYPKNQRWTVENEEYCLEKTCYVGLEEPRLILFTKTQAEALAAVMNKLEENNG